MSLNRAVQAYGCCPPPAFVVTWSTLREENLCSANIPVDDISSALSHKPSQLTISPSHVSRQPGSLMTVLRTRVWTGNGFSGMRQRGANTSALKARQTRQAWTPTTIFTEQGNTWSWPWPSLRKPSRHAPALSDGYISRVVSILRDWVMDTSLGDFHGIGPHRDCLHTLSALGNATHSSQPRKRPHGSGGTQLPILSPASCMDTPSGEHIYTNPPTCEPTWNT